MADLLFVAVREDVECAEALADMFEAAGLSIESPFSEEALQTCGAVVLIWSGDAKINGAFLTAAQSAIEAGKAIVASLVPPTQNLVASAPTFDLSNWNGRADAAEIDGVFHAAYKMAVGARRDVDADVLREHVGPAANDNPVLATPVEAANPADAWIAQLPEGPLPVPQSRAAQVRHGRRWFGLGGRAMAVMALIGAAAFAENQARREWIAPDPTTFAELVVTKVGDIAAPADEAPFVDAPPYVREPASAPRG